MLRNRRKYIKFELPSSIFDQYDQKIGPLQFALLDNINDILSNIYYMRFNNHYGFSFLISGLINPNICDIFFRLIDSGIKCKTEFYLPNGKFLIKDSHIVEPINTYEHPKYIYELSSTNKGKLFYNGVITCYGIAIKIE